MLKKMFFVSLLLAAAPVAAANLPSSPSLKPPVIYASKVVSTQDAAILREAFRAADEGNWSLVRRKHAEARDEVVADLILWRMATSDSAMSFDQLNTALEHMTAWPMRTTMRIKAEEVISLSALDYKERIDWLEASGPISGEGKIALADAWRAIGEPARANEIIRDAWRNNRFDSFREKDILDRYAGILSQDDHEARVEYLLWTGQRSAASRLKPRLSAGYRTLVDARIALATRGRGVDRKINAIPDSLKSNPGLLYERAKWRRNRGHLDTAIPLLTQIDGADIPAAGRRTLWRERSIALRTALKDGDYTTAYALAAPHGMTSGKEFADAEWTAGWIALRLTHDAARAASHFQTLGAGVKTPISQARASYWNGRALQALGDIEAANTAYETAARFNFTYYGQLAAEQTGAMKIVLEPTDMPSAEAESAFMERPMVKALRLLGEAGETRLFRKFAYHLDDQLETPAEFELLAALAEDYRLPDIGVRGAKAGLAKGIIVPNAAYPIISFNLLRTQKVETALILALTRQESEMNPMAHSFAGAYGLMQFMPRTASQQARLEGLPYRRSWLIDDPAYNMTLGDAHLDDLLDRFNGSYIMTAAAYNAGASRPAKWIEDYGDPRMGEVDPIDWVEFIPFSETRNYVQRVLENIQVYRQRTDEDGESIRLSHDLQRGKIR